MSSFLCICVTACRLAAVVLPAIAESPAPPLQATSAPSDDSTRITPLASARIGDWADYNMLGGRQIVRVVHTTLLLADVEVQSFLNGKPVGLPARRTLKQDSDWALDFADADGAKVTAAHDTIDAAGRRWACRWTVATWKRGPDTCERRVWMHPDVPVYGVVRMELRVNGKITARMELTAFGRGSTTTQPAP